MDEPSLAADGEVTVCVCIAVLGLVTIDFHGAETLPGSSSRGST